MAEHHELNVCDREEHGDVLAVVDWSQRLAFYTVAGKTVREAPQFMITSTLSRTLFVLCKEISLLEAVFKLFVIGPSTVHDTTYS